MINNLYLTTTHQMDASQTTNQPTQEEGVNEKSNPTNQATSRMQSKQTADKIKKKGSDFGQCDRRNDSLLSVCLSVKGGKTRAGVHQPHPQPALATSHPPWCATGIVHVPYSATQRGS